MLRRSVKIQSLLVLLPDEPLEELVELLSDELPPVVPVVVEVVAGAVEGVVAVDGAALLLEG